MIGFTGPYSDINFGDYAMLVNNLYELGASQARVFVYDQEFFSRIQQHYLSEMEVFVTEVRMKPSFVSDLADWRFMTPLEIMRGVENLDEIVDAVSPLDVMYVNGGGYLNSLWTRPHRIERLLSILAPVIVAATAGTPVRFTANGYGPYRGDLEFFASLFGLLPQARFGARDRVLSPYWLAQAGVRPAQVRLLPDDLLFIDQRLSRGGRMPRSDRYVVMETYLPTEYITVNINRFERFASDLRNRHGLDLVFLPLNLAHGGVEQGRLLAERVEGIELVDITSHGFLPIEDAVAVVQNAELVISSRYHAEILALSQGVPFVSVLKDVLGDLQYYHAKNVGALESVLQGTPHDLRDYFFVDYMEALEVVGQRIEGIVERQTTAYASAFPRASAALRGARRDFLRGDE